MENTSDSLASILAAVAEARDRRGRRVARLLHDESGQTISALGFHLDAVRSDAEHACPAVAERIAGTQRILQQAVEEVRSLSNAMNPEVVERFGLESALRYLTHRYADPKGLEVSLRYNAPAKLDPITARAFHRITECALERALAGGQKQRITISVRELNGGVELAVESNGEQWNAGPADLERALIKHHADAAEIELNVNPSFNGGTIILARRGNSNKLERN